VPVSEARAFEEFLRCGIGEGDLAGLPAQVLGPSDRRRMTAFAGEEIVVEGLYARGQAFAAYRSGGGCAHQFLGSVVVTGAHPSGASRGRVREAVRGLKRGDLLLPMEAVRAEFEQQRRDGRRDREGVTGRVRCVGDGGELAMTPGDTLVVDRGTRHGVAMGDAWDLVRPVSEGAVSSARVVRVGREVSFARVHRLIQPVRAGDAVRLAREAGGGESSGGGHRTRR
jgi:hypothetical protein